MNHDLLAALLSATPGLLVAIPFGGAVLVFLLGRLVTPLGLATSAATAALAVVAAWGTAHGTSVGQAVGGWQAPLGIELRADGFGVLMLLATAVVGLAVSAQAVPYFAAHDERFEWRRQTSFWALWLALWASLNALLLTADSFNAYVCLELATIAAVALVTLSGDQRALASALRYLLTAFMGALAFLGGVALAYALVGELSFAALGRLPEGPATTVTLGLLTLGLAVKAALFPLHFWLPGAHSRAPVPASAVLSGLVVGAALYLLLRLWLELLPAHATQVWAPLLGAVAIAALVLGSYRAFRAERLKLLLAHSTVAQVGLIVLALPVGLGATGLAGGEGLLEARDGATLLAVSHGLAKAALFLGAGALMHAAGHDRLAGLDGTGRRLPVVVLAMAIAGASLAGLPFTGGEAGKHLLTEVAAEGGQWWWWLALQLSTFLTLAYVGVVLWRTLAAGGDGTRDEMRRVPLMMQLAPLALALAALGIGLTKAQWRSLIDAGLGAVVGGGP